MKYLEIKYGGKKKKKDNIQLELTPPTTPINSVIKTPSPSKTFDSTIVESDTPFTNIEPITLNRLIENKDEIICLLLANPILSNYKITAKNKGFEKDLYINFEKKKKKFAHFSFHYPTEDNLRIGDMFEANTFHLKLDKYKHDIVFNLDEKDLKLKSKLDDFQIELIIGHDNFVEIKKIITSLEQIFSSEKYKRILQNATARRLDF